MFTVYKLAHPRTVLVQNIIQREKHYRKYVQLRIHYLKVYVNRQSRNQHGNFTHDSDIDLEVMFFILVKCMLIAEILMQIGVKYVRKIIMISMLTVHELGYHRTVLVRNIIQRDKHYRNIVQLRIHYLKVYIKRYYQSQCGKFTHISEIHLEEMFHISKMHVSC